jgi:hypothetical protein
MKVIVASTDVPFVGGGGNTAIVDWLGLELTRAGHDVDTLRFPFVSETTAMLDQRWPSGCSTSTTPLIG